MSSFGDPATPGAFELSVGTPAICAGSPCVPLDPTARPLSTPLTVLRSDGEGFLVLTMWYVPAACSKGKTYVTVHDVGMGTVQQQTGMQVANEPVTGLVIADGKVMYIDSQAGIQQLNAAQIGAVVRPGGVGGPPGPTGPYQVNAWREVP